MSSPVFKTDTLIITSIRVWLAVWVGPPWREAMRGRIAGKKGGGLERGDIELTTTLGAASAPGQALHNSSPPTAGPMGSTQQVLVNEGDSSVWSFEKRTGLEPLDRAYPRQGPFTSAPVRARTSSCFPLGNKESTGALVGTGRDRAHCGAAAMCWALRGTSYTLSTMFTTNQR